MRLIPHLAIGLWASLLVTSAAANGLDRAPNFRARQCIPGTAGSARAAAARASGRAAGARAKRHAGSGTRRSIRQARQYTQAPTKVYAYEVFYNAPKKKLEKKLVDLSILQRKVAEPPLSRAALIRQGRKRCGALPKSADSRTDITPTRSSRRSTSQTPRSPSPSILHSRPPVHTRAIPDRL